jgi:6-phosphogluconolactonase
VSHGSELIYVGCYTGESGGQGRGIVAARRDPGSGELHVVGVVAATAAPSFLCWHPTLPVLYAVNEVVEGTVAAWTAEPDGALRPLGGRSSGGDSPCHVAVSAGGKHLLSANYGSGSVAVHPLNPTGAVGERSDLLVHSGRGADPQRQDRAHAHMVSPDPDGRGVFAVDLGTDSIYRYDLDPATGRLLPQGPRVRTRVGSGPRHIARHPDGRRCFVVGELDATVTGYELQPGGVLHERSRVPATERTGSTQPSDIAVRADGRFLYVANRGPDTVAVFALQGTSARYVTEVESGGHWPRHFALIGDHLYVANERSHTIGIFRVDHGSGVPAPIGDPVEVPSPTCVLAGRRA